MLLLAQCWGRPFPAGHMQHLGTLVLFSAQMAATFLLQGEGLQQHCYRCHRRRNLLDGSSRLTILQQAVTFHFLKWAVPPPYSSWKTEPLQGVGQDVSALQALPLRRQDFSCLAFPSKFAGAQNSRSFLITKIELISPWTDSAYLAYCHQ